MKLRAAPLGAVAGIEHELHAEDAGGVALHALETMRAMIARDSSIGLIKLDDAQRMLGAAYGDAAHLRSKLGAPRPDGLRFYLGTHQPHWLDFAEVPLFVSAVTLRKRRRLPRARVPWALDSGGFSEIAAHGRWIISPQQYADEVRRWRDAIGNLEWAAIQDWMCEPPMLEKTGRALGLGRPSTVREHQLRTIKSYATLSRLAPDVRWTPVLQGWHRDDYLEHIDMYAAAGFHLHQEPIVGVGSVCRRQGTREAAKIMRSIWMHDIRIHAFGIKTQGLALFGDCISSADSMAWSFVARREPVLLDECRRDLAVNHKNCANCFRFAMQWHAKLIAKLPNAVR